MLINAETATLLVLTATYTVYKQIRFIRERCSETSKHVDTRPSVFLADRINGRAYATVLFCLLQQSLGLHVLTICV